MTTRDPRSRGYVRPPSQGTGRDPTQSLSVSPDEEPSHPSLALGTHEANGRERASTRVESPNARERPPSISKPPPIPARPADDVDGYVGSTLGSYKVHELLGKGGMGYVFRAEHVKLGREVALKLLRGDYAKRRDAVARFFQEARTVNRVRHRNIVDVTDFVELPDGTTFIIMEFLRGQSLGKWARTGVDLPRALAVLVQICDGLGAAHQVGVIHRDLKPDNVIVVPTSDGAELVKLLDFGVAKLVNRDDEDVGFQTAAGSVIGTPAYMSPEQAGGMVVDARSDIYSLGAIMYELFCGQPMFRGRSFGEYVRKHLTEMPTPPHKTQGGNGIEPRLEILIMRCLEKDPNVRFSSIIELRDMMLGILGGMETMPPGLVSLVQSGIRPGPTMVPAMLPTAIAPIPSLPPMQHMPTPQAASGMHSAQASQSYPFAQQFQTGQAYQTGQAGPAPTPWWVWFVGGAIAVAIGITAALWYAGRSEVPAAKAVAEQPRPEAQPTEPDVKAVPPVAPTKLELRFDSLPSGGVFADGQSAELCRTPCAFTLDLDDGGPKEHRRFLVRSEGYKDGAVDVDLSGSQREFRVTLAKMEPTIVQQVEPDRTEPTKSKVGSKKVAKQVDKTPDKQPDKVADKPPDKKPDGADLDDPTEGKKPIKKPDKGIDATETIDPFHRKKR